jgi:chemotaxis protein methyltransferase CheR
VRLPEVLQKIDTLLGFRYQPHQWSDLLRLLKPAARELGYADLEDFLARLAKGDQDEKTLNVLAKHLTIGESYFFREIVVFSILGSGSSRNARTQARAGRAGVRVWSAGCSTGEEVYSIAILLDSFLSDLPDWQFTVLGTDVNPVAVERAREGVYRDWSFRDVPMDIHAAYFERTEDGKHAVVDRIKQRTEFRQLNLVTAPALFPTASI